MEVKRVLWLEDQYPKFHKVFIELYRAGYLFDPVKTVSQAVERMRAWKYSHYIIDLIVPPGENETWFEFYKRMLKESKEAPCLGFELLRSIFEPGKAAVKIHPPIEIDSKRVIIFTNVYYKTDELLSFGIPGANIIMKTSSSESIAAIIKETEFMRSNR